MVLTTLTIHRPASSQYKSHDSVPFAQHWTPAPPTWHPRAQAKHEHSQGAWEKSARAGGTERRSENWVTHAINPLQEAGGEQFRPGINFLSRGEVRGKRNKKHQSKKKASLYYSFLWLNYAYFWALSSHISHMAVQAKFIYIRISF